MYVCVCVCPCEIFTCVFACVSSHNKHISMHVKTKVYMLNCLSHHVLCIYVFVVCGRGSQVGMCTYMCVHMSVKARSWQWVSFLITLQFIYESGSLVRPCQFCFVYTVSLAKVTPLPASQLLRLQVAATLAWILCECWIYEVSSSH